MSTEKEVFKDLPEPIETLVCTKTSSSLEQNSSEVYCFLHFVSYISTKLKRMLEKSCNPDLLLDSLTVACRKQSHGTETHRTERLLTSLAIFSCIDICLGFSWDRIVFFRVFGMMLCFGSKRKTMLVIHQCL